MPTYEGLRLKLLAIPRKNKLLTEYRRKRLKLTDFTIISNNCWGGMIYESYNIPKHSPTIGLFFMASDYVKFISDLEGYISGDLKFINPVYSRWKDEPQISRDRRFGTYPIGVLSNGNEEIEIFFLHYHSEQEAKEKWERRCKRINWDKMLVKFNDQNGCTLQDIKAFMKLPFKNKLFFTCKNWIDVPKDQYILIRQFPKYKQIMASFEPFGKTKYVNIHQEINNL